MRGGTCTLAQLVGSIPRQYTGALTVGPFDGRTYPMTTNIYLLSNAPLRGTITSVSARDAQASTLYPGTTMPAQWAFQGRFDGDARAKKDQVWSGSGDAMLYVDQDKMTTPLMDIGLVARAGDRNGKPVYQVVYGGEVQFMQREENKRKHITLSRVGEPAAPQPAPTTPVYKTLNDDPRPPFPGRVTVVENMPGSAPATDEWAALEARYARCAEIAKRIWSPMDYEGGTLVSAAATLFIQAEKEHLPITTMMLTTNVQVPAARGDPTDAQVTLLRDLLRNEVFTKDEREKGLATIYGATVASMNEQLARLQRIIKTRSFADVPPALQHGDASDETDMPF